MTYSQPMQSYISARGRSTAITVLVLVQIVALAISTVAWLAGVAHLGGNATAAIAAFGIAGVGETVHSLLFLAATVVFMTWVYRSIANLPALGSMSCRFTPSGAVWSFFIPFVNLVRGHQVMATIWQESQPPAVSDNGFYLPRKSTLVNWWWGLYLFAGVVGLVVSNSHPFTAEDVRSLGRTATVLNAMRVVDGILFLLMVRGAQARQDEMWLDLERRRNVPQPSADALR